MSEKKQSAKDIKVFRQGEIEFVQSRLALAGREEYVIAATGSDGEGVEQLVHDQMMSADSRPIARFGFGRKSHYQLLGTAISREDGCLLQHKENGQADRLFSLQVTSLSGSSLFPLRQQGRNIGVVYEDDEARYCRLSGVVPLRLDESREGQTRAVLEMLEWILETNGFVFTDTLRTWFYLDHLLDWYDDFNRIRTRFFEERGVFAKLVPASTGIGAANPWGAALICDLFAVQPKTREACITAVSSPLQNSALEYASSFSRAVEISMPSSRSLLISGTASIDHSGKTQFAGDSPRQIEKTIQVVTALLESRGMNWTDVIRGIAYFVDLSDKAVFDSLCRDYGVPSFPLAIACADICRQDLRFELEVDGVKMERMRFP